MPALAPAAVAEVSRPIQVHVYPPTPVETKPCLPEALVNLFLRELSTEPHKNGFLCDTCGCPYNLTVMDGKSCTNLTGARGNHRCHGTITLRWTKEKAHDELLRLMTQGGVAVAWELAEPPVPVGLMVCEAHRSDSLPVAIDFQMGTLESIYWNLGRKEPFLVVTHVWLDRVVQSQEVLLMRKLLEGAAEDVMHSQGLTDAIVLVPVSSRDTELRRQPLAQMTEGKHQVLARDARASRERELWGFKLRTH
ncbi:hypothetical protein HY631_00300 [Candidatus Uhrbacteria bacterium]|nr:hypothetical protein [Candidatus Uhrbacteria bacterium]